MSSGHLLTSSTVLGFVDFYFSPATHLSNTANLTLGGEVNGVYSVNGEQRT